MQVFKSSGWPLSGGDEIPWLSHETPLILYKTNKTCAVVSFAYLLQVAIQLNNIKKEWLA